MIKLQVQDSKTIERKKKIKHRSLDLEIRK